MKTLTLLRASTFSLAVALAGSAAAQEVEVSENARQHFKTGVAYLEDPDGARYEEAYREFKAAYADSPSWKILGNLGITSMKLERDGEAIEAYDKYLTQGGTQIDAGERAQFERDLLTTKAGVVWVNVDVAPTGATIIDERQPLTGRPVTNRYMVGPDGKLRIGIRRGHHKLTAQLQGYEDAHVEFDAEAGSEQSHAFKLVPPKPAGLVTGPASGGGPAGADGGPATERPIGTPIIIGAVATGALLIGGGVVGVMAMGKNSEFKEKNDGQNVAEADDLQKSGKTLNLIADITLGAGVVAGVVTAVLFVSRPEVPASGPPAEATGKLRFTPVVTTNAGAMVLSGRF